MRKSLWQKLFAGALFGLGLILTPLLAAPLTTFTGPSGSNPIAFPSDLADVNTVIQGVNNNAAFSGNGTPSQMIGATFTSSLKLGSQSTTTTVLQFVNPIMFTSTVATATCTISSGLVHNPAGCMAFFDNNGTLRWMPFY